MEKEKEKGKGKIPWGAQHIQSQADENKSVRIADWKGERIAD